MNLIHPSRGGWQQTLIKVAFWTQKISDTTTLAHRASTANFKIIIFGFRGRVKLVSNNSKFLYFQIIHTTTLQVEDQLLSATISHSWDELSLTHAPRFEEEKHTVLCLTNSRLNHKLFSFPHSLGTCIITLGHLLHLMQKELLNLNHYYRIAIRKILSS